MKKLSIILIILSFLFVNQVSACGCGPDIHKVATTVDNVIYDSDTDEYYFISVKDSEGGQWALQVDEDDIGTDRSIEALTAKFKGVGVEVYYVGNVQTDEEIEIVTSRIIKGDES